MNEDQEEKKHNLILYVLLGGCIIAIISSLYFFYFKKDYEFIVETKCDPTTETCFYRDCTNPDDCPPNNLSYYNQYSLKASDFKACADEDCSYACVNNVISCIKIECTISDVENETCVSPNNSIVQ
jgi:hypothetical protein